MKTAIQKSMGHSKCSSKREVYSDTGLPQETRKISNNINLHLKELEEELTKPKLSERNNKYERRNK